MLSRICWNRGRVPAGLVAVALAALALPGARAKFIRPELEKVPVERLVKNLEDLAAKEPKDARVRYNLARVHGMAYALKADSTEVRKGREQDGAWFGFTPAFVPYKPVETRDEARLRAAKEHLAKSIAAYEQAVRLDPDFLPARLGLAWSLEQKGDKEAAVKAYREVVEKGWAAEKDLKSGPLGGHFITAEAGGYLAALLDRDKDRDEIATLKERSERLAKLPRPVTPIAVPLRDGLAARDLEDARASVAFDADGTGLRRRWTWVTRDAGWLVYDPRGTGEVTSGLQLFGGVSFWTFWDNGYQALRLLDDDGDGLLAGREVDGLAIWRDGNGDGVCDPGEVRPLAAYGIVAVSACCQRDPSHPDRIWWSPRGVRFRDGSTRPTFDLILKPR
jgi:tetratricopeptide (TPR) repeat protein